VAQSVRRHEPSGSVVDVVVGGGGRVVVLAGAALVGVASDDVVDVVAVVDVVLALVVDVVVAVVRRGSAPMMNCAVVRPSVKIRAGVNGLENVTPSSRLNEDTTVDVASS
jgi:hypothetical protein